MRTFFALLLFTFIFTVSLHAQTARKFSIVYLSSTHVYINGGRDDGLQVGDTLRVFRNGHYISTIRVDYLASHSASCLALENKHGIHQNDLAVFQSDTKKKSKVSPNKANRTTGIAHLSNASAPAQKVKQSFSRVRGYLSLQYYRFSDLKSHQYDFSQPTVRLRVRIDNMWTPGINFEMRFRTRYNHRRRFLGTLPKNEWQHRLYRFALSYRPSGSDLQFKLGRIISNVLSGVGYIDGALLQSQIRPYWYAGAFGGTQPDWRTSNWQLEIQKYGVFIRYLKGRYGEVRKAFTLAASGEYHGKTVSREFLFLQGSYDHGKHWHFYQQLELDVNRAWRKARAGEALSISGLYVNGRYDINRKASVTISYDNRKNYYTYETRTIADSIFDKAMRQGIRLSGYLRLWQDYRLAIHIGVRDRQTAARFTYNYGLNVSKRRFWGSGNTLFLNIVGFDNVFANGLNPNLRISHRFHGGHYLSLNYGNYFYTFKRNGGRRINQWVRINSQLELPMQLYASFDYEYDWGNDLHGTRLFAEIGYRF